MTILLILGELLYGYEIQNNASKKLGRSISPGTVYVLLGSLRKKRLAEIIEQKTVNGRKMTVYSITEKEKFSS